MASNDHDAAGSGAPAPADRDRWGFVLEAEPGPVPVEVRMRQALKYLLRRHGLRCVGLFAAVMPEGLERVRFLEE